MRKLLTLTVVCALGLAASVSAQQDGALQAAGTALGVGTVKTLEFTGAGAMFSVGQNYTATEAWPRVTVKAYTAQINYDTASMRQELVRESGAVMPRGGGAPFTGEQRQILLVSGDFAWNIPAAGPPAAPEPGRLSLPQAFEVSGVRPPPPQAQPAAAAQPERMLALWATPQGFVRAAMANNATTRSSRGATEVSFTVGGKYKMVGTINAQGQVDKVQTWIYHPIVGDMLVETTYTGYKDFGGVMFPARILQTQDGFPSLDITVEKVTANPAVAIAVPANVQTPPAPAPITVTVQKMGEGAYYLTGGTHHSLAIEMKDHIVIVDLPNNQARAEAVLAKAKETIPNKPVRFVVAQHHHWDHLGGIRAAMAEGATIVTHQSNKAFLERVAKTPHTLAPDRQAETRKGAKVKTIADKGTLSDGTRVIELYLLTGLEHTGDMLAVYLPQEKLLAEADAFTPPAQAGQPLVAPAVPFAKALYDNIQRRKLDVQVIAPFHGARTATVAEVAGAAGVQTTN